jgi:hypothetical protein
MTQVHAQGKYVGISAQKVRLVVDLVRGKPADSALTMLKFLPNAAAEPVAGLDLTRRCFDRGDTSQPGERGVGEDAPGDVSPVHDEAFELSIDQSGHRRLDPDDRVATSAHAHESERRAVDVIGEIGIFGDVPWRSLKEQVGRVVLYNSESIPIRRNRDSRCCDGSSHSKYQVGNRFFVRSLMGC